LVTGNGGFLGAPLFYSESVLEEQLEKVEMETGNEKWKWKMETVKSRYICKLG